MFGRNDLVDILSRDLNRARGKLDFLASKRDTLASDVTTLTAQIAEIEARLSEERSRRERDRIAGEIEGIKRRIQETTGTFVPAVAGLCKAIAMAAPVVPEARELNSFVLSVAAEVDTVIGPLLCELDRRADAVRVGEAAPDLPRPANEATKDNSNRLLRFPIWLSRMMEAGKKELAERRRSAAA